MCGLAPGTLRDHAGIESVCQVSEDEDEVVLAQRVVEAALESAGVDISEVDLLVATSTTFLRLPSLSATLHSRLLLPESSGTLDVGGACVGVIQALATAKALVAVGQCRTALVAASEVPSRRLALSSATGEFRGLFGDGACAFLLSRSDSPFGRWKLGDFIWGCSGASAASLQLEMREGSPLRVEFQGEPLARAALSHLERLLQSLEMLTGKPRSEVAYFALHESNPRLVEILSRSAGVPLEKMAPISRTCGNLGAATCGVNLCAALAKAEADQAISEPLVVFIAGVGPGLVFGATYLDRHP
jgi:3-oxoacyl-[acyl-carrier-protein] synthase-3